MSLSIVCEQVIIVKKKRKKQWKTENIVITMKHFQMNQFMALNNS